MAHIHKTCIEPYITHTKLPFLPVNQDPMTEGIKKGALKAGNIAEIKSFSLLKHHPLMCGSFIYYLNSGLQALGITYDACQDAILSSVHLYNAAKHANCITEAWADLEYLISLHTPKHIFSGGIPTERKDFFKRFSLALGAGALNFAKNRRAQKLVMKRPRRAQADSQYVPTRPSTLSLPLSCSSIHEYFSASELCL